MTTSVRGAMGSRDPVYIIRGGPTRTTQVGPGVPMRPATIAPDRCHRNEPDGQMPDIPASAAPWPYHSQLPGRVVGEPAGRPIASSDAPAAHTRSDRRKDLRSAANPSFRKPSGLSPDGVWVSLSGARPKGPRPDLKDGPQKVLLTRLNELNNPYRVSYEMVSRQLWSDQAPTKIQRSRTRDLSRQLRGEKAIEWRVVEIYVDLLFPATDPLRASELIVLRDLHTQAFGTTVDPDGAPSPEPEAAPIDPAYVAELERQLEEARTRASFATALLVIVQAENTTLRGRNSSFDWFHQPARAGSGRSAAEGGSRSRSGRRAATDQHASSSTNGRTTTGRAGGTRSGAPNAAGTPSAPAASSTPRTGRREPGPNAEGEVFRSADPVTTPIVRRQGYRAGQRRRPATTRATLADAFPTGPRAVVHPTTAPPAPASTLATPARGRSTSNSLHRAPTPDPPADESGLDVLVSREKRRRGKNT